MQSVQGSSWTFLLNSLLSLVISAPSTPIATIALNHIETLFLESHSNQEVSILRGENAQRVYTTLIDMMMAPPNQGTSPSTVPDPSSLVKSLSNILSHSLPQICKYDIKDKDIIFSSLLTHVKKLTLLDSSISGSTSSVADPGYMVLDTLVSSIVSVYSRNDAVPLVWIYINIYIILLY
jgi:hypothetical protein